MRPLYDGVGGNAMWAVMTVAVVFESTVGATLCKCINRATGTFLAGSLALGVQWIANKSGETFEHIIIGISIFLLALAATFSRFIPSVKKLVIKMKTLTKSSKIELLIGEMNFAIQKLQESLNSVPNSFIGPTVSTLRAPNEANRETVPKTAIPSLMDVFPMASLVYLLIEIAARIEGIADAVDQLAGLAKFKLALYRNLVTARNMKSVSIL